MQSNGIYIFQVYLLRIERYIEMKLTQANYFFIMPFIYSELKLGK